MFKIEGKLSDSSFVDFASSKNTNINSQEILDKEAINFGVLENARSVVMWAYDDRRSINDYSEVIELDNGYVIAYLSNINNYI